MKLEGNPMSQHPHTQFPLTGAIYQRASHVLNGCNLNQWQASTNTLRTEMDALKASLHIKELEEFSGEFARRLIQDGGWELQFFPDYMRDENGTWNFTVDDAAALLGNWPDPTRLPDGYPDQQFSDIEILEAILHQRRRSSQDGQPTDAQCYALIALEKVFMVDVLFFEGSKNGRSTDQSMFQASMLAIEAMEMVCTAEREQVLARLPEVTTDQIRKVEAEVLKDSRRSMAKAGAEARWMNDPKAIAKQQVKECWEMWQAAPQNYKSATAFARDMLSKYEDLENPDVIRRWCREWQAESASNIMTPPAAS